MHNHVGVLPSQYRNYDFNLEDLSSQKFFKKNVRESWKQQLNKFHKYNPSKIAKKINQFAEKNGFPPQKIPIDNLP